MILCINICNFNNFICPVSKDQLFKIIVWRNARKWSLRWCRRCVHTCRSSCGQHILRGSIKSLETGLRRSRLIWLVVFLEHDWIMFPLILGMSSSQLTNSYFSEGFKPPTSDTVDRRTPAPVDSWIPLFLEFLPSGYTKIAMENGHRNSGFSQWFSIAMLNF